MSTQTVDLSNSNLESPIALVATKRPDPKTIAADTTEKPVCDVFEIRRREFFGK